MADLRALMAQERRARRITHEFATYNKSGGLVCTACNLAVKSETLWEGHLKSLNHKKNTVKELASRPVAKRKIEDVDEPQDEEDVDVRKKLKAKSEHLSISRNISVEDGSAVKDKTINTDAETKRILPETPGQFTQPEPTDSREERQSNARTTSVAEPEAKLDEDEWAAFEQDIAPLARADYAAATITSAPVTAAQIEAEAEADRRRLRDTEAEDEKEDEGRRIEEELGVMEEMEERVRNLKAKREALRLPSGSIGQSGGIVAGDGSAIVPEHIDGNAKTGGSTQEEIERENHDEDEDEDDDDDDVDDWYS